MGNNLIDRIIGSCLDRSKIESTAAVKSSDSFAFRCSSRDGHWPLKSFHGNHILKLPCLVEEGFCRAIEAEHWEKASSGDCLNPVPLFLRLVRPERNVDRAVRIANGFGVAAHGRKWLPVLQL
jgi:hypothetical protein